MNIAHHTGPASFGTQGRDDKSWYVRPFRPGDEAGLCRLFEQVFGRSRTLEHLQWKLLARNTGPAQMVWVAADSASEVLIGHYGGIPLGMQMQGRPVAAVHSVEAMADPNYRRQGILTALGTSAHQEWSNHGYELVIGLPNDKWGTRNAALGYVQMFPLVWLRFPLRLDRVIARRTDGSLPAKLIQAPARIASRLWRSAHYTNSAHGSRITAVDTNIQAQVGALDDLWSSLSKGYSNAVNRSSQWLRWRYGAEPSGTFRLMLSSRGTRPSGLIAYRAQKSAERITGFVADLHTAPGDTLAVRSLLAAALDELDRAGAGSVLAVAPPGSPQYAQLVKHGFHPLRTGFSFEIVPLSANVDPERLRDPAEWHLTAGDFDIV